MAGAQTRAGYEKDSVRPRRSDSTPDSQRRRYEARKRPEKSIADYIDEAFSEGEAAGAKSAQADAASQTSSSEPAPAPSYSAPNLSTPGVSLGIGSGGPDRATSARIIVVIVALSAIGTVADDAIVGTSPSKTTVKVGNGTVTVPTHLRTLGAVLVMGTIALVVNEVDPGIGLLLGVGIGLDVAATTLVGTNGLFSRLQGGIFASSAQVKGGFANGPVNANGVPIYSVIPPSTIGPTGIIGPAGVATPNQVWNGKAWVPVVSTRTN